LLYWYQRTYTLHICTKVQILTLFRTAQDLDGDGVVTAAELKVLTLLALLAQKYQYRRSRPKSRHSLPQFSAPGASGKFLVLSLLALLVQKYKY
jgi:hypothetical protein